MKEKAAKALRRLKAKSVEILPRVFHLSFDSHKKLIDTFLRPREFFESTFYKNKSIQKAQFKAWYAKEFGDGKFTYYQDWAAFNMPEDALTAFKKRHALDTNEKLLFEVVKPLREGFYLIATSKAVEKDIRYLKHEIAHALFATNPSYRRSVKKILNRLNLKPIFDWLKAENYHKSRYLDEAHSYLLDGHAFLREELGINPRPYRRAIRQLRTLLQSTSGPWLSQSACKKSH